MRQRQSGEISVQFLLALALRADLTQLQPLEALHVPLRLSRVHQSPWPQRLGNFKENDRTQIIQSDSRESEKISVAKYGVLHQGRQNQAQNEANGRVDDPRPLH